MPSAISTFLTAAEIAMMRSGRRHEPKRPIWNSTRRVATIFRPMATAATSVNAWLSCTWITSGWNAAMVRRRCHQARGSRPISHAVPSTRTPPAAARCASSLPCLVTSACSISASRPSSRQRSRTWFWPPRHSRPESTCRTRSLLHSGKYAAQCVELEGLLQERTAQLFEELQRVAADRVARGEDDAIGHRRMHAGECVEHLAPTQPGHSQIADDQVEWLHQRPLQCLAPVVRQYDLVTPAFECRLHVVEDVRLVINHEYPETFLPLGWGWLALRTTGQRAELRADPRRQLHGEGRATAAARAARIHRDVAAVLLDDAERNRETEAGAFPFGFGAEERFEHALRHGLRYAGPVVGNVDGKAVRLALGGDLDPPFSSARAGDRLRGVVDDVHEHLLDLIRVYLDFREPRLEGERELDARGEQLVLQELMGGLENGPDRLQLALAFLAPRERQQVAHDRRGALGFLANHRERLGQARRHVCRLAEQVAEPDHRGEGVVEVVRDAGDQLPDRRHLLGLQQLLLEPAFFGLVFEQQHGGAGLTGGNGGHQQRPLAPSDLDRRGGAFGREQPRDGIAPRRRQERQPGPSRKRGHGQLDQLREHTIGAPHGAVGIDITDGLIERVNRLLPLALAARQELHQACVLECDSGLCQNGARKHQRSLIEAVGAALHCDGADRPRHGDNRDAEPARRRRLVHLDVELGGTRGHLVWKNERPTAERE